LQGELNQAVTFHTAVVSNEMRDNIDRLRKREQYCHKDVLTDPKHIYDIYTSKVLELLKPANMDASTRRPCLDGT